MVLPLDLEPPLNTRIFVPRKPSDGQDFLGNRDLRRTINLLLEPMSIIGEIRGADNSGCHNALSLHIRQNRALRRRLPVGCKIRWSTAFVGAVHLAK
jgi:hypothetical protein